ncbi:hypothetical protein N9955_00260 [bacterium]|nr:hypothetical protein [bacterium]
MNDKRYKIEGNSIFFNDVDICLHKSFCLKFKGLTIPQTRRKLKKEMGWERKAQDEIIHFLKSEGIIIEQKKHWINYIQEPKQ